MDVKGTYLTDFDLTPVLGLTAINNCAGNFGNTCGAPLNELIVNTRLTWNSGPWGLSGLVRYLSAADDDSIENENDDDDECIDDNGGIDDDDDNDDDADDDDDKSLSSQRTVFPLPRSVDNLIRKYTRKVKPHCPAAPQVSHLIGHLQPGF